MLISDHLVTWWWHGTLSRWCMTIICMINASVHTKLQWHIGHSWAQSLDVNYIRVKYFRTFSVSEHIFATNKMGITVYIFNITLGSRCLCSGRRSWEFWWSGFWPCMVLWVLCTKLTSLVSSRSVPKYPLFQKYLQCHYIMKFPTKTDVGCCISTCLDVNCKCGGLEQSFHRCDRESLINKERFHSLPWSVRIWFHKPNCNTIFL